jgi:hypothetical protein
MVSALALHFLLVVPLFCIIDETVPELLKEELFDEGPPVLLLDADYEQNTPSAEAHQMYK